MLCTRNTSKRLKSISEAGNILSAEGALSPYAAPHSGRSNPMSPNKCAFAVAGSIYRYDSAEWCMRAAIIVGLYSRDGTHNPPL